MMFKKKYFDVKTGEPLILNYTYFGNQKIKSDNGKPKCRLVPSEIVRCIARVREYGLKKYGSAESWQKVEVERYQDAMYRHLLAYIENPTGKDEESGLPHLWHIACNVAFLCELQKGDYNK
jgi:hypothetical protein